MLATDLDSFLAKSDLEIGRYEQKNASVFFHALRIGDVEAVRKCLKRGYSPNHVSFFQQNNLRPLMYVGPEIGTVLLDAGANPNLRDNQGRLILNTLCIWYEHPPVEYVELLLTRGANPNTHDESGFPLDTVDLATALVLEKHGGNIWGDYPPNAAVHKIVARRKTEAIATKITDLPLRRVYEYLHPDFESVWRAGVESFFGVHVATPQNESVRAQIERGNGV